LIGEYSRPRAAPAPAERRHEERIAIIGAGPVRLTAAQDLVRQGYGVTVFEALPAPGGMLRSACRHIACLPTSSAREIQDILDLGVDLRLNTPVDNLD